MRVFQASSSRAAIPAEAGRQLRAEYRGWAGQHRQAGTNNSAGDLTESEDPSVSYTKLRQLEDISLRPQSTVR